MFDIVTTVDCANSHTVMLSCLNCCTIANVNTRCFKEITPTRLTLKDNITLTCQCCGSKHQAKVNPYISITKQNPVKKSYEFSESEILMSSIVWD